MRYLILKPRENTFDPRHTSIRDAAHLHDLIPPIADCANELEAKYAIRRAFPDAQAMPFVIELGSGQTVLLGFIEDPSRGINSEREIPFSVFVQPVSQLEGDRQRIGRAIKGQERLFSSELWRLKPIRPSFSQTIPIEWRTSELAAPAFLNAEAGYDESGRLVLYAEMGKDVMSIRFRQPNLALEERDHRPAVAVSSPSVGPSIVRE